MLKKKLIISNGPTISCKLYWLIGLEKKRVSNNSRIANAYYVGMPLQFRQISRTLYIKAGYQLLNVDVHYLFSPRMEMEYIIINAYLYGHLDAPATDIIL